MILGVLKMEVYNGLYELRNCCYSSGKGTNKCRLFVGTRSLFLKNKSYVHVCSVRDSIPMHGQMRLMIITLLTLIAMKKSCTAFVALSVSLSISNALPESKKLKNISIFNQETVWSYQQAYAIVHRSALMALPVWRVLATLRRGGLSLSLVTRPTPPTGQGQTGFLPRIGLA
jgi:hypothetical protein